MSALSTLINEYHELANEHAELQDLYIEDAQKFETVQRLLEMQHLRGVPVKQLNRYVEQMDTAPREEVLVALAKDKGVQYVAETFGYDLEGWV
jgi:hypothetical protein|tara:strand:+ start:410 stop:688 length:279 start_codon:yes stop_codon:yes gene_type:complete